MGGSNLKFERAGTGFHYALTYKVSIQHNSDRLKTFFAWLELAGLGGVDEEILGGLERERN
jgi:hypothetical protein